MSEQNENKLKLSIDDKELTLLQNFCNLRSAQDQVLWSIFGAFWGTNALLLVSVFAADQSWKLKLILILISFIGIVVSSIWLIIQSRTLARIKMYEDSIAEIEKNNKFPDYLRTFSKQPPKGVKARIAMKRSVQFAMSGWIITFIFSIALEFFCCT